jgi:hypothetical protein
VQVFRYVTEQSFDAYMWQTLETKARFIGQVMTGESDLRRIEDIDGAALTYAEVKAIASGNPLVIEKAQVDTELTRLGRLRCEHEETRFKLRSRIRHLTDEIPVMERRHEAARHDLAGRRDTSGENFMATIEGKDIRDRGIAGELLLHHAGRITPIARWESRRVHVASRRWFRFWAVQLPPTVEMHFFIREVQRRRLCHPGGTFGRVGWPKTVQGAISINDSKFQ